MPPRAVAIVFPSHLFRVKLCALLCGFALLLFLGGCGGGGGSKPVVTRVTVSPAIANVLPGKTQQFRATVSGSGSPSTAVTWSVKSVGFGSTGDGSISASGLYTAPAAQPEPNTVTIEATSVADPAQSGWADAVIGRAPPPITGIRLSPTKANVNTLATLQFKATLQGPGAANGVVLWYVDSERGGDPFDGTISDSGLYTAPDQLPLGGLPVSVTATSAEDPSISATALINITPGPPVVKELTPSTANATDAIQVMGQNLFLRGATVTVFFSGPNGVPLPVPIPDGVSYPTQLGLYVPLAAVSGPVYVQSQMPGAPPQISNSVTFTRLPRVRIRAPGRDLSQGESTVFQSRILSGNGSETLAWTADVGSVTNDGSYTAPPSVASDGFALVTACITGTQICDQERLGLHPFRITPNVPVIPLGGTVQLQAVQNGSVVNATWQSTGPGTLQPDGTYTASTLPADGGGIPVSATYGGVTEQVSVAVTGGFNGLVNRVSDYVDLVQYPFPLGTWTVDVGVVGNKAYVLATDQIDFVLDNPYYWVDVYDLTDPIHPVWVDAFEPATRGHFLRCDGYTYQINEGSAPGVIATYDTSGPSPVLLSKQISPVDSIGPTSQDGCLITEVASDHLPGSSGEPTLVDLLNLVNGGVIHSQYTLTVPGPPPIGFASDGNRLYARTVPDLYVYDLTVQPPEQIGSLSFGIAPGIQPTIVGNLLFESQQGGFRAESQIYDITNPQPTFLQYLGVGRVLGINNTQVLAGSFNAGLQLADVSNPLQPAITGTLFDFLDSAYTTVLHGTYVYETEEQGGLAVYDVSAGGGLAESYLKITPSNVGPPALAQAENSSNLFFAAANPYGSGVLSFNLNTQPASYIGSFSTGTSLAQALALSGNDLYVGTVDSLRVLDVSNPSNPSQIGSVGLGVLSLAISGTTLYAGTMDGRLVVFDVTQPSNPVQKASLSLPDLANQMTVSATLLLVADVTGGLLVYDISVPTAPTLLSQIRPASAVFDVAADGNLALLAAWEAGLVVVDLTNPSQPQVVGQAALGNDQPYSYSPVIVNKAFSVTLANKIAYIGVNNFDTDFNDGQASIYGFDYSQPKNPRLVSLGACDNEFINDGILTLRAAGGKIFAGTSLELLLELDASHPQNVINLSFLPASLMAQPLGSAAPPGMTQRTKLLRNTRLARSNDSAYSQRRHVELERRHVH